MDTQNGKTIRQSGIEVAESKDWPGKLTGPSSVTLHIHLVPLSILLSLSSGQFGLEGGRKRNGSPIRRQSASEKRSAPIRV